MVEKLTHELCELMYRNLTISSVTSRMSRYIACDDSILVSFTIDVFVSCTNHLGKLHKYILTVSIADGAQTPTYDLWCTETKSFVKILPGYIVENIVPILNKYNAVFAKGGDL